MSKLPGRFIEDRTLRDKARAVLAEDIEHLKGMLGEEGIAGRVSSGVTASIGMRVRDGARDLLDQAKARAADSKGVLALLVGALLLLFARERIIAWFEELRADPDETGEGDEPKVASFEAASAGDPE